MNQPARACESADPQAAIPVSARMLPFARGDGPFHMAADEVLLDIAAEGMAAIRLYAWEPATLSLGYFQKHQERLLDPRLAALPWVRRATGGGAIVHDADLTYAIAVPARARLGLRPEEWHCRIHRALTSWLQARGIAAKVHSGCRAPQADLGYLCFAVPQPGDVLLDGRKIIGGAQRLRRGALLQHGSILLPAAVPEADPLAAVLAEDLGWTLVRSQWSNAERERITAMATQKYSTQSWNEKR